MYVQCICVLRKCLQVGGVVCVTLGHELSEGIAKHDYFGTHRVLKDLEVCVSEGGVIAWFFLSRTHICALHAVLCGTGERESVCVCVDTEIEK